MRAESSGNTAAWEGGGDTNAHVSPPTAMPGLVCWSVSSPVLCRPSHGTVLGADYRGTGGVILSKKGSQPRGKMGYESGDV